MKTMATWCGGSSSKRCQVVVGGGVRVAGIARWARKRCQVVEGGCIHMAGIARWARKRCQVVEGGCIHMAGIARWAMRTIDAWGTPARQVLSHPAAPHWTGFSFMLLAIRRPSCPSHRLIRPSIGASTAAKRSAGVFGNQG
jgi:hypothetical protein